MKYRKWMMVMTAVLALGAAGCGKKEEAAELTPTPAPTATPIPVTPTPTPLPTATPAPRVIGVKSAGAKFIYLTNNTEKEIRELYLRTSGTEDWGKSLMPAESAIKSSAQVQLYYTPADGEDSVYDLKLVSRDGKTYEIYSADLEDMEKASLKLQEDTAYLSYISVSSRKEKDTRDGEKVSASYSEDEEESYDDSSWYEDDDDTDNYDNGNSNGSGNTSDNGNGDAADNDNGNAAGDTTENGDGNGDGNTDGDGTGNSDGSGNSDGTGDGDGTGDDGSTGDDDPGDITVNDEPGTGDQLVWDEDGNWTEE